VHPEHVEERRQRATDVVVQTETGEGLVAVCCEERTDGRTRVNGWCCVLFYFNQNIISKNILTNFKIT